MFGGRADAAVEGSGYQRHCDVLEDTLNRFLPAPGPDGVNRNNPFYGAVADEKPPDKQAPPGWGVRHTLAVLICIGLALATSLRVNISMAIVAMVNNTAISMLSSTNNLTISSRDNFRSGNRSWQISSKAPEDGPFVWSPLTQGMVLSAYFAGNILSQVPGGRLAERVGAVRTLGVGLALTGLLTLLTPLFAFWSATGLIALRVMIGFTNGVTQPSIHCLLARWVPPNERSRISSFVYTGRQLGGAAAILAAGPLSGLHWAGGWQAIFYFSGALSLLWVAAAAASLYETPAQHPRISFRERVYLHSHIKQHGDGVSVVRFPWRCAMTSRPFLALAVVHFCNNWGDFLISTELPTYIRTVLRYPLSTNAMFSALPQLAKVVVALMTAPAADWLQTSNRLSLGPNRKLWNSIGMYIPAACLVAVSYAGYHDVLAITLMVLATGVNGTTLSGYSVNHMDLASNFAGTLLGITNGLATISGLLAPFQAGYVLTQSPSLSNWRTVFLTAAGVLTFGNTVFLVFGSAEEQTWNNPPEMQSLTAAHSEKTDNPESTV